MVEKYRKNYTVTAICVECAARYLLPVARRWRHKRVDGSGRSDYRVVQENEVSLRPSENQEVIEGRVPAEPAPQYGSNHYAKAQPAVSDQAETEVEITR